MNEEDQRRTRTRTREDYNDYVVWISSLVRSSFKLNIDNLDHHVFLYFEQIEKEDYYCVKDKTLENALK